MIRTRIALMIVATALAVGACGFASAADAKGTGGFRGLASWYGPGLHGRRTANGEQFNSHELTAAHRSLPFGSRIKVTNERTGHSVVVRINDRGPFTGGRIIDLSQAAARAVGLSGVGRVSLTRL